MKTITYQTVGTCARFIELTGEDGRIVDVKFFGGCNGKPTSCPDQLCCAIEELMKACASE